MRTMNCQNVRREVDEAGPGDLLSAFARRHMSACRECRAFCEEHEKLQAILSSLGTIEAPGDFDFRLRARLAGEKAGNAHFPLNKLSFGFRAAVVATLLVVFGAVAFVNFKPSSNNSLISKNTTPASKTVEQAQPGTIVAPQSAELVAVGTTPVADDGRNFVPKRQVTPKHGLASAQNTPRMGTREMGSTPAKTLRASDLNAQVADYPIGSSAQPMKVSLDNGRGSSRTISLPPVSFGSQRVLAQGTAPLMASARGSW